jgi:tetratricopeptide (TPR) repeat protein
MPALWLLGSAATRCATSIRRRRRSAPLRAKVQIERGNYDGAERALDASLAAARRCGDRSQIADALAFLGEVHKERGDFEEASVCLEEALQIDREVFGDSHPRIDSDQYALASVLKELGRYEEAAAMLREVVRHDRERLGRHPSTALSIGGLAGVLIRQGAFGEAFTLYDEALAIQRDTLPEGHFEIANTLSNLGVAYANAGRPDLARPLLEEALQIRLAQFEEDHPSVLTARSLMAMNLMATGDRDDVENATQQYREVYEARVRILGDAPQTAGSLFSLAYAVGRAGDVDEAERLTRESIEMYRRVLPGGVGMDLLRPLRFLGVLLTRQGRAAEGEPLLAEGVRIVEGMEGLEPDHPERVGARRAWAESLCEVGRFDESAESLKRVLEDLEATGLEHNARAIDSTRRQLEYVETQRRVRGG